MCRSINFGKKKLDIKARKSQAIFPTRPMYHVLCLIINLSFFAVPCVRHPDGGRWEET